MCKFSSKAVPHVLRRCTFLYPCVYETALPVLLYATHTHTHTCFLHWMGLPTKQLLAIPKVAGETLQWKKFLEISMYQRICGEVTQR